MRSCHLNVGGTGTSQQPNRSTSQSERESKPRDNSRYGERTSQWNPVGTDDFRLSTVARSSDRALSLHLTGESESLAITTGSSRRRRQEQPLPTPREESLLERLRSRLHAEQEAEDSRGLWFLRRHSLSSAGFENSPSTSNHDDQIPEETTITTRSSEKLYYLYSSLLF